jgi:hypothetical protein
LHCSAQVFCYRGSLIHLLCPLRSLFVTPLSRFATLSTTAHKTRERVFSALWRQLEDRKKLSDLVQLAAPLQARPHV